MILGADGKILAGAQPESLRTVEIVRSFSFKLNCERYNPAMRFESRDFFMSQKSYCDESERLSISAALHSFCKSEVMKSVNECIAELLAMRAEAEKSWEQPKARKTA